jgi:hypothetical protein
MRVKRLALNVKQPSRLAQDWVNQGSTAPAADIVPKAQLYTARLTLDITADLRQRIKLAALSGGTTVANLLRDILEREFADVPDRGP